MHQRWADYRIFWRQFREAYHSTGAVLPSGRALSRALSRYVREHETHIAESQRNLETAVPERLPHVGRRILEVGPGTGAVTARIMRDMRPNDRLVLVERNDQFVERLRGRLADVSPNGAAERVTLIHASVEDLPDGEPYDLIISGLPLNNFSVASVEQIFGKLRRLLTAGGTLSFFEYVAVREVKSAVIRSERERLQRIGRIFRDMLRTEVRRDLVLANVPPAWVHHVRLSNSS
jgi:phospholipid N-methyltransferase